MACQIPHSFRTALISLKPVGEGAIAVLESDSNKSLRFNGALHVGQVSSKVQAPGNTRYIATIGRDGDVVIPDEFSSISRVHCSFLADPEKKCVSFQFDPRSSRVYGRGGKPLGKNTYRADDTYSRVDREGDVEICSIELGKKGDKTFHFTVWWNFDIQDTASCLRQWWKTNLPARPSLAETQHANNGVNEGATEPYRKVAQAGDAIRHCGEVKVQRRRRLGHGAWGVVYEGVMDTGQLVAVKELQRPTEREVWATLRRELRIHSALRHPNIVQYIGGRGWEDKSGPLEIYMALKEGTLEDLIKREVRPDDGPLAAVVYHDMLRALDYIHRKGFIHRDLKPANILFTFKDGKYSFQLADFGLSNDQPLARSFCGSPMYMAPEINSGREQTTAIDMWSLFVTIFWVVNVEGFRGKQEFGTYLAFLFWLVGAASRNWKQFRSVQGLMVLDHTRRASAAQVLLTFFDGEGLTTPKRHIAQWKPSSRPPSDHDVFVFGQPPKPPAPRIARRRGLAAPTRRGPVSAGGRVNKVALKTPKLVLAKPPEYRPIKPLENLPTKPQAVRDRWRLWRALVGTEHAAVVATPAVDLKQAERNQMPGAFPSF